MSKKSRERRKNHIRKAGGIVDFFMFFNEHSDLSHFGTHNEWKLIVSLLKNATRDDFVSIRSNTIVETVRDKIIKNNTEQKDDIEFIRSLSGDAPLRDPFGKIIAFDFKVPGADNYAVLCVILPDKNRILTQGIRIRGDTVYLDESVGVLSLDEGACLLDYEFAFGTEESVRDAYITMAEAIFGLALINASNIELIDHEPEPDVSHEYERYFGQPLTKYKTLAIKQMGKRYESSDPKPYQDLMPEHLRRGGWMHFTEDAPAFGKPWGVGTFWRPATVVGNKKNGVVVKDYKVEVPED